ncbi:MAG TPA: hypothetical protein VG056_08810 [Pirellulales bacterium]|jgi:ribosomal protein L37AE/L43A|nr:hypothetical protein [Pirellulales bacterium]
MSSANPYESPKESTPIKRPGEQFAPCPRCGNTAASRVGFTFWGGVIGPKLLTHVKCDQCGAKYNGKTGKSNTAAIVVYQVVGLLIAVAILVALRFR